ncbi:hypothetical protein [Streptomyces sp. G45]|uniref:hypothetical protein n=1 Tax=Streptomyces sp. G45 TaxID=3406627 RepID=UPI003C13CAAC
MPATPAAWALLLLALTTAVLTGLLVAVATALLARRDGASRPGALLRAGGAFGVTLTVATALLALIVG